MLGKHQDNVGHVVAEVREQSISICRRSSERNAQHIWARFNGESISASVIHRQADNGRSPSNEGTSSTELNTQYQQLVATLSAAFTWHDIDIFASSIISQGDDIGKSSSTFPQQRISSYPQDDHLLSQIEFSSLGQWKVKLYQHQQQWQTHIVRLDDNQATDYFKHALILKIINTHIIYANIYTQNI